MSTETEYRKAKDIAQSELALRRCRLGQLTPEQELSIERLLISTVYKISEMLVTTVQLLDRHHKIQSEVLDFRS